MSERSQRTANRSAFLAIGLLLVFFVIAGVGSWEGMMGLALGLMMYFIALAHVPLGILAVAAAIGSGNHWRNTWIYLYFGGFALIVIGYVAVSNDWGKFVGLQFERVIHPETVALRKALGRLSTDPAKALEAIDAGADVNTHDDYQRTPLMMAANAGRADLVQRLLEAGAEVNARANDGANALHFGAAGGAFRYENAPEFNVNTQVLATLLDAGIEVNVSTTDGRTPILGACTAGSVKAVTLLLNAGADPSVASANGGDCLTAALEGGQADFIRWLLTDSGASVDSGSALVTALARNRPELFELLLELGADPAALIQPRRSMSLAERLIDDDPGHARMRQALIDSGRAARAFAAGGANELRNVLIRSGDPQKLENLLDLGANPDATGDWHETALHYLAGSAGGTTGIPNARLLIAADADVDARGRDQLTPLGVAAHNGRLEMVQFLIDQGADVNHTDEHGNDPLLLAAAEGYGYIIEALANAGANLPPPLQQRHYLSASKNYVPGISALLAFGLDPNQPDERGKLTLFDVIESGPPAAIVALLEGGASLDVVDSGSYSPLTAAADRNREDVIEVLIKAGADPNAADKRGRTPLEVTIGDRAIASTIALLRNGAAISVLQRKRIEQQMVNEAYRGRDRDRKDELRALL